MAGDRGHGGGHGAWIVASCTWWRGAAGGGSWSATVASSASPRKSSIAPQAQLNRHGALAVFLGRLFPGLRVVTAIACGIFRVRFRVFLPAMALGGLIYIFGYTLLGYFAGPAVFGLIEALHLPVAMFGSGVPLLLLVGALILIRRGLPHPMPRPYLRPWHRARVGLLAGILASAGALLSLDLVVALTGDLAWRLPDSLSGADHQRALAYARARRNGRHCVAGGPLIAGVGWGAVYAVWAEPRLPGPDVVRGLLFAVVPFVVGSVLLAPLLTQMRDAMQLAPVALLTEFGAPGVLWRDSGARVSGASRAPSAGRSPGAQPDASATL